jgi:uncharacterized membrane protein YfcA
MPHIRAARVAGRISNPPRERYASPRWRLNRSIIRARFKDSMPLMPLAFSMGFADNITVALGCILAAMGVIILGISKSGFGGGAGIIAVPLFAIAFGAQRGSAILLPLLIAADLFSVYHHWGQWDKTILRILIPGTLLGIAIGSVVLWLIVLGPIAPWRYDGSHGHDAPATRSAAAQKNSANGLNLITGIISVLYVLLDRVLRRFAPKFQFAPTHRSGLAAGSAVGVISTLAHAAGPVAAIFLLNQGLPRATFMGTMVVYFFGINITKLIPYTLIPGLTDFSTALTGLVFLPFVPLGTVLGKYLCDRMSEKFFRNAVLLLTLVTGLQLTLESLMGFKLTELFLHPR